jgi:thiol-disulfide isomerase/thioredoxin
VALQSENKNVQFIGVNVRDSAETANAFERNFEITWPSIVDAKTGSVLLAFTGIVTPQAVPTTLVIGKDGKVTARVLGRIDKSILGALIKTAVEE